jgi:hypothetical protein
VQCVRAPPFEDAIEKKRVKKPRRPTGLFFGYWVVTTANDAGLTRPFLLMKMLVTQFNTPILGIDHVAVINGWCLKTRMMGVGKEGS